MRSILINPVNNIKYHLWQKDTGTYFGTARVSKLARGSVGARDASAGRQTMWAKDGMAVFYKGMT